MKLTKTQRLKVQLDKLTKDYPSNEIHQYDDYSDLALGPEQHWPTYVHGHIYRSLIEKVSEAIYLAVLNDRKERISRAALADEKEGK